VRFSARVAERWSLRCRAMEPLVDVAVAPGPYLAIREEAMVAGGMIGAEPGRAGCFVASVLGGVLGPCGSAERVRPYVYRGRRSLGSTSSASASLRMVRAWGSTWLRSMRTMVVTPTPDVSASCSWVSRARFRRSLSLSPMYSTLPRIVADLLPGCRFPCQKLPLNLH
jgi:hypothetical protein